MLDHEEQFLFKEEILHLSNAMAEPGTLDNVEDLLTDVITSPRFDSEVFTLERSLQVMLGGRAGTTLVGLLTVAPGDTVPRTSPRRSKCRRTSPQRRRSWLSPCRSRAATASRSRRRSGPRGGCGLDETFEAGTAGLESDAPRLVGTAIDPNVKPTRRDGVAETVGPLDEHDAGSLAIVEQA